MASTHKILLALGLSLILLSSVAPTFAFARGHDSGTTWNGPIFYGCPNSASERNAYAVELAAYNARSNFSQSLRVSRPSPPTPTPPPPTPQPTQTNQVTTQVTPVNSEEEITFVTPIPTSSVILGPFNIQITAQPSLVAPGGTSIISWNQGVDITRVQSCIVEGTNSDRWSTDQGSRSALIDDETVFTLQCTRTDGETATDSVKVRLVPSWQEF